MDNNNTSIIKGIIVGASIFCGVLSAIGAMVSYFKNGGIQTPQLPYSQPTCEPVPTIMNRCMQNPYNPTPVVYPVQYPVYTAAPVVMNNSIVPSLNRYPLMTPQFKCSNQELMWQNVPNGDRVIASIPDVFGNNTNPVGYTQYGYGYADNQFPGVSVWNNNHFGQYRPIYQQPQINNGFGFTGGGTNYMTKDQPTSAYGKLSYEPSRSDGVIPLHGDPSWFIRSV